jgi:hypothetical protein
MHGWAVEVTFQYLDGTWAPAQLWYAAVSDKNAAQNLVRQRANVSNSVKVEAKAQISENEIIGLKLSPNQARQWI